MIRYPLPCAILIVLTAFFLLALVVLWQPSGPPAAPFLPSSRRERIETIFSAAGTPSVVNPARPEAPKTLLGLSTRPLAPVVSRYDFEPFDVPPDKLPTFLAGSFKSQAPPTGTRVIVVGHVLGMGTTGYSEHAFWNVSTGLGYAGFVDDTSVEQAQVRCVFAGGRPIGMADGNFFRIEGIYHGTAASGIPVLVDCDECR